MPAVTTSDLSKRPGETLDRVERGERLVVCRHRRPVATLQPLDGYVFQPFSGAVHDVFGWPFGDEAAQVEALTEAEQALLLNGCRMLRLSANVPLCEKFGSSLMHQTIEEMKSRGLARKTPRGVELTGRGLALRETLMKMEGREAELSA
jgi:antitoxin (DNA-binding transcriptional repressor) of toxin-antitoxin stability system